MAANPVLRPGRPAADLRVGEKIRGITGENRGPLYITNLTNLLRYIYKGAYMYILPHRCYIYTPLYMEVSPSCRQGRFSRQKSQKPRKHGPKRGMGASDWVGRTGVLGRGPVGRTTQTHDFRMFPSMSRKKRYALVPPVTFFVARFLLQDMGVLAGRFRHGFCPQSSMIRGVLPPEPTWRPVDR